MTICIHYARPASGQGDGEVFGLDVAVGNLLTAWFRHGAAGAFVCRPTDIPSFEHFKELASAAGLDAEQRCIGLDPRTPQHNLESIGCLFRPDPLTADLVWRRQQLRGRGFATCGLVHTMSGERIARAVGELCIAPTDSTDALICPSAAIRDAVRNLWDIYGEYLGHRFGAKVQCPVQTPVIPLGIDTDNFRQRATPERRATQRQALGLAADEVMILFTGRLSFATKAHPLALWSAAERAARQTARKVRLVMHGYFKPKDMEKHFRTLAAAIGQTVAIDFVMNDDARFPEGLWAGADIFVSLSDNVQESFGLTPVEAMACGLPAVVTDWDGYRGSVRDGLDGFLVPTATPPAFAGQDIAAAYYNEENYGVALMGAAQSTAVDIDACAKALLRLIDDAALRRRMGESGRAHARDTFDWRHIIKAYEALWLELKEKRRGQPLSPGIPQGWNAAHPAYPNPWKMFESFPSRILAPGDRFGIVMDGPAIDALMAHEMNFFIPELLVPKESMRELIEAIRRANAPPASAILAAFPDHEHGRLWRCLGWMLKHGVATIERPTP